MPSQEENVARPCFLGNRVFHLLPMRDLIVPSSLGIVHYSSPTLSHGARYARHQKRAWERGPLGWHSTKKLSSGSAAVPTFASRTPLANSPDHKNHVVYLSDLDGGMYPEFKQALLTTGRNEALHDSPDSCASLSLRDLLGDRRVQR